MPLVAPILPGQNVTMVKGLSERARAVEAMRNQLAIATFAGATAVSNGGPYPNGWPEMSVLVGTSGCVFCQVGWAASDTSGSTPDVGVSVDGATPTYVVSAYTAGESFQFTSSGLSAGWHSFTLVSMSSLAGTTTYAMVFMTCWPL